MYVCASNLSYYNSNTIADIITDTGIDAVTGSSLSKDRKSVND
jgi:hypothetical protein